jgi:hypothetical protein
MGAILQTTTMRLLEENRYHFRAVPIRSIGGTAGMGGDALSSHPVGHNLR